MIYCDSSFLVSLYLVTDVFNAQSRREASKFTTAIAYTLFSELEVLNTLRRSLGTAALDQTEHDATLRELEADESEGLLQRVPLNQIKLYEKARELSRKYNPDLGCRALDILHVASALILGAESFASFDYRKRKLAAAVGLPLVPPSLPQ